MRGLSKPVRISGSALPIAVAILVVVGFFAASTSSNRQETREDRIRGVTVDARSEPDPGALERLKAIGVTHITLVQFGFQRDMSVPEIRMNTDARWVSESDTGIRAIATQADALGMEIVLKPHIWVGRYSSEGQTRAEIGYEFEDEWERWEEDYRTLLLHYARLAQETGAAVLVIGTELRRSALEREEFWRRLIHDIRAAYEGKLTYAANWWEEYEDIAFWDALDYVGVQAYFELSHEPEPTVEALLAGWAPHKQALRRIAGTVKKPMLFTEIGYRNVPDAAAAPWRWPSREEAASVQPDDALQSRLYDAFFQSFWEEPWFAGAILWKWNASTMRRSNYLDFSFRGKPVEEVIAHWFRGK